VKINGKGELTDTNQQAWVNENGLTNAMSFFKLAKDEGAHVTCDNHTEDDLIITHPKTGTMKFLPSQQGPHHFDATENDEITPVNTITNDKSGHSQMQLQQAGMTAQKTSKAW